MFSKIVPLVLIVIAITAYGGFLRSKEIHKEVNTSSVVEEISTTTTDIASTTAHSTEKVATNSSEVKISITTIPQNPIQGEPVAIVIDGLSATTSIKSALLDKTALNFFMFDGKPTALYGIDLSAKTGIRNIVINLSNEEVTKGSFMVGARKKVEAPLGIPEKLGGNTREAADTLVNNIVDEQVILNQITNIIRGQNYWKDEFVWPVKNPVVTDIYGYTRNTVGYEIPHKGTDFRALEGTEVFAINRGIVRMADEYTAFGKMVTVDHGFGLYSIYLHLSKINVNVGELVTPGEVIGLSGSTGYAGGPHLHISIRLNGVSIDPIRFYSIFGTVLSPN